VLLNERGTRFRYVGKSNSDRFSNRTEQLSSSRFTPLLKPSLARVELIAEGSAKASSANRCNFANSRPSAAAIDATIAYIEYVYERYARFPAYAAPFRTIIGFQVCRPDPDFQRKFYSADQK
jgi:hypothetical protein